jgi:hypothetical protein
VRAAPGLLVAALLVAAPVAGSACSVGPDYRVPTNLELAAQAESIVLARVIAGELDPGEDPFESTVTVRPLAAVKGPLPQGDIVLKGLMLTRDAGQEYAALSNPYEFEVAHPISYIGGCIRYLFPLGTTALFFLRPDPEEVWAPAGAPFARWAEDVPDADAPWVQLVRLYVRAAELPEEDRAELLEGEREALAARADDPIAQLMARDIARQLAGPNQPWNTLIGRELRPSDEQEDPAAVESSVEAVIEAMRRAAIEAGN